MTDKMTAKDHIALLRTLARNWWLFWNKAWNNKEFFRDLEQIANMESLASVREDLPFPNTEISMIEWYAHHPESHEKVLQIGRKIQSQMSIGHILKMEEVLSVWMDKLDFGPEWKNTLVTFITTGILCPPIYTFHIEMTRAKNDRKSDKRLVKIVLSPETSIDEIRLAWKLKIVKMKEDGWPDFEAKKLSKGLKNNLIEELAVTKAKNSLTHEFMFPNLNEMERQAVKGSKDPEAVKKIAMVYRRKMREIEHVKVKQIKVRTRKTYNDVAVELHGALKNKDIKKKAALLRQHKHRLKM
jgi:hypothetical protein